MKPQHANLHAEVFYVQEIFYVRAKIRAKRGEVSFYVITTPLDKIEHMFYCGHAVGRIRKRKKGKLDC